MYCACTNFSSRPFNPQPSDGQCFEEGVEVVVFNLPRALAKYNNTTVTTMHCEFVNRGSRICTLETNCKPTLLWPALSHTLPPWRGPIESSLRRRSIRGTPVSS